MLILHDIWVNWAESSRAYSIPEYHEWKKDDEVELIDTIPMIIVEPELFNILEDDYLDIPAALLKEVHRVAKKVNKETNRKKLVDYCFIATDMQRIIAIDTEGDTKPNLKSRLAPRNEAFALEIAQDCGEPTQYPLPKDEFEGLEVDTSLMGQILSFDPEYFTGLTRTEKEMKEILLDCLFNVSCSENPHEVFYWYLELFPTEYNNGSIPEHDDMIRKMFDFLKIGWSQQHVDYGSHLIRFNDNDIYKDEWKELVFRSKRLDKVESK
jgi:hypothetical protein